MYILLPYTTIVNATKTKTVPTLKGSYPHQQIKVRSQPDPSIAKKHDGMQNSRPVLPTKSGHT